LSDTLEDGLTGESVEICVIDENGYNELSSEDTEKHLAKLKA
jgi:20S proteasome alpha/beta subunit